MTEETIEKETYHVFVELTVDATIFDDAAQVELWVESQLSQEPDIAIAETSTAQPL
jgi:hypothetical protein